MLVNTGNTLSDLVKRLACLAHEFHAAATLLEEGSPLYAMSDAAGADLGTTGLVDGRVSGSWAHVIEPTPG